MKYRYWAVVAVKDGAMVESADGGRAHIYRTRAQAREAKKRLGPDRFEPGEWEFIKVIPVAIKTS